MTEATESEDLITANMARAGAVTLFRYANHNPDFDYAVASRLVFEAMAAQGYQDDVESSGYNPEAN